MYSKQLPIKQCTKCQGLWELYFKLYYIGDSRLHHFKTDRATKFPTFRKTSRMENLRQG